MVSIFMLSGEKTPDARGSEPDQQPQSVPVRMNQVKAEEKYSPGAPVYQENPISPHIGLILGTPVKFLPEGTPKLSSMCMTSASLPRLRSRAPQYYGDGMNMMQNYCMNQLPVELSQESLVTFRPEGTRILPSVTTMTSTHTPLPPGRTLVHNQKAMDEQMNARPYLVNSGDLTACQLRNTSSSLPQEVAGAGAHSSLKPVDTLRKREHRLMKNREAARECRRKKKEYVRCLENRVAVLENQNKTLIEELRALKDIYRHKVE